MTTFLLMVISFGVGIIVGAAGYWFLRRKGIDVNIPE